MSGFFARISQDRTLWIVSTAVSVALYVAIAVYIPVALARLPPDAFVRPEPPRRPLAIVLRFVIGIVVVLAGVAMLFLPGPGVLTILLGLTIVGGRLARRGVRKLVTQPKVFAAINAVRAKRGRPPLIHPGQQPGAPRG
jgi:hypothetical protein